MPCNNTDPIGQTGREIRRIRAEARTKIPGGLRGTGILARDVHPTLELPGRNPLKDAHAALDAAVRAAYGFDAKGDLLGQLLTLYLKVAASTESNQSATAPGIPSSYPSPAQLVADDCIQP